jgi:putative phage-type endonuclease
MEQRSEEWFEKRRGKVTASRIGDLLATIRNGNWAASRRNYAAELVTERLTGRTAPGFQSEHMQYAIEHEPLARDAYMRKTGFDVKEVAFVDHPRILYSGASPDGLVFDEGLIEIKCLNTANQIELLLKGEVDEKYRLQMVWQMACTGRQWCDFVAYEPNLPPEMQLFIKRFQRDDKEIHHLENEVEIFLNEVAATEAALKGKYNSE